MIIKVLKNNSLVCSSIISTKERIIKKISNMDYEKMLHQNPTKSKKNIQKILKHMIKNIAKYKIVKTESQKDIEERIRSCIYRFILGDYNAINLSLFEEVFTLENNNMVIKILSYSFVQNVLSMIYRGEISLTGQKGIYRIMNLILKDQNMPNLNIKRFFEDMIPYIEYRYDKNLIEAIKAFIKNDREEYMKLINNIFQDRKIETYEKFGIIGLIFENNIFTTDNKKQILTSEDQDALIDLTLTFMQNSLNDINLRLNKNRLHPVLEFIDNYIFQNPEYFGTNIVKLIKFVEDLVVDRTMKLHLKKGLIGVILNRNGCLEYMPNSINIIEGLLQNIPDFINIMKDLLESNQLHNKQILIELIFDNRKHLEKHISDIINIMKNFLSNDKIHNKQLKELFFSDHKYLEEYMQDFIDTMKDLLKNDQFYYKPKLIELILYNRENLHLNKHMEDFINIMKDLLKNNQYSKFYYESRLIKSILNLNNKDDQFYQETQLIELIFKNRKHLETHMEDFINIMKDLLKDDQFDHKLQLIELILKNCEHLETHMKDFINIMKDLLKDDQFDHKQQLIELIFKNCEHLETHMKDFINIMKDLLEDDQFDHKQQLIELIFKNHEPLKTHMEDFIKIMQDSLKNDQYDQYSQFFYKPQLIELIFDNRKHLETHMEDFINIMKDLLEDDQFYYKPKLIELILDNRENLHLNKHIPYFMNTVKDLLEDDQFHNKTKLIELISKHKEYLEKNLINIDFIYDHEESEEELEESLFNNQESEEELEENSNGNINKYKLFF